jgi:hypothetical protein
MKGLIKKNIVLLIIAFGFAMASCNACAKCTEPGTGVAMNSVAKKFPLNPMLGS